MGRIGLKTPEETAAFGQKMALDLPPHSILALSGDLGAGKTTFVQGLAIGLGISEPVQSPTFVLLNIYADRLFHFDLYRLKTPADFTRLGFEEYFQGGGICAIEWSERIASILPPQTLFLHFTHDPSGRIVEVRP